MRFREHLRRLACASQRAGENVVDRTIFNCPADCLRLAAADLTER
jgi:hypothetical protein